MSFGKSLWVPISTCRHLDTSKNCPKCCFNSSHTARRADTPFLSYTIPQVTAFHLNGCCRCWTEHSTKPSHTRRRMRSCRQGVRKGQSSESQMSQAAQLSGPWLLIMAGRGEGEEGNASQTHSSCPGFLWHGTAPFFYLTTKGASNSSVPPKCSFQALPTPACLSCSVCLEGALYQSNHESSLAVMSLFKGKPEMQKVHSQWSQKQLGENT